MERRVKRTLFQTKGRFRDLFDVNSNPVSMHATAGSECLQHQQIERTLQAIVRVSSRQAPPSYSQLWEAYPNASIGVNEC